MELGKCIGFASDTPPKLRVQPRVPVHVSITGAAGNIATYNTGFEVDQNDIEEIVVNQHLK